MIFSVLIFIGKLILGFLALTFLYFLLAFLLSWLPKHRHYTNSENGFEVYVMSNGVHVDFVLLIDQLPAEWLKNIDMNEYGFTKEQATYLGFGWGDRGFYLNTPTWAELKFSTAVNALFLPSPAFLQKLHFFFRVLFFFRDSYGIQSQCQCGRTED